MQESSTAVFRLSPQQKAVWLNQSPACPWNAVCLVDVQGQVEESRLRDALRAVTARHEILRTVYRLQPGMKVPFQMVQDDAEFDWEVATIDDAELLRRERNHRFNFETGPLFRAVFHRLTEERASLILTAPALAADARSFDAIVRDLSAAYDGDSQPDGEESLRYAQFSQWQLDVLEAVDESAVEARAYWAERRSREVLPLALPGVQAAGAGSQAGCVVTELRGDTANLTEHVLLAAWQSLLWRLTGQTHFDTRVFSSGREYEELEFAVGTIGKFLPVSARFDGDFTFQDIVDHVRSTVDSASHWQEYFTPGEGSEDGSAAAFEYSQAAAPSDKQNGVQFTIASRSSCAERSTVKLGVFSKPHALTLELCFDSARIEQVVAARWLGHYVTLLKAAVAASGTLVSRLPLLTDSERDVLLKEWNDTASEYPREQRLHELFEAQVARTPERVAVRSGNDELTYAHLNSRANQLAHHLARVGVNPGALVGLVLERGVDMIVGLLAIMKAGAGYVPLNADSPRPRLLAQLAHTAALLTQSQLAGHMAEYAGPALRIDADAQLWSGESAANPGTAGTSDNLAYVIFTSGSTGTPKGVGVTHRNLVNYAEFMRRKLGDERASEALHFATVSTLSADLGNTSIFPSLLSGGCLHVIPHDIAADSAQMADYCRRHPIDVLKIVPSHLEALLVTAEGAGVLPRKTLITGGEALTPRVARRVRELSPECRILNHYGPTETTIGSLTFPVTDEAYAAGGDETIPIGRPIANTQVYILDSFSQPVAIGVTGELYIAGDGVTFGYIGQPELTAERFPENPFGAGRMYRTGDLARYRDDGNVQFLGRADDQVKIRGFRIEPGEVEAVLRTFTGVRQAAVIARRDARGDMRLIGYIVSDPARPVAIPAVRDYLKTQLPDYMVPAGLVVLAKLPLTANGKIDRQSLPEPEQVQAKIFVAPVTENEIAVARIWSEVFDREQISADDDFFQIGGHSLTATQVISRVREQFHVMLDMRVVFDRPTIAGMAAAIEAARSQPETVEPALVAVSRERYRRK